MDFRDVRPVLEALEREGVRYALFGGLAMAAYGLARATEDLDIFLPPEPDNIDRLRRALHTVFQDPHVDEITVADLAGEYPAVQYGPPGVSFTIDIVARLGEAYSFGDLVVERVTVDDLEVAVVSPRTLYEMKRDTVRQRDADDAARLRRKYRFQDN